MRIKSALLPSLFCGLLLQSLIFSDTASAALHMDDLFRTDRVLKVEISVAPEDWDTIRRQSREIFEVLGEERRLGPIESPYTYVKADVVIDGVAFKGVGIRKKGFIGSQSSTRPSLKIKLDFTDKKAEIDKVNVLTFNNNSQDRSLLSQYLGYRVFRQVGVPASRCSYAQVIVNGKNLGVYSHVESVKKPMMEREFGDDGGVLYEGTIVDFHPGWEASFERKFGKKKKGQKLIASLTELLNREGVAQSAEFERELGEFVDLPSFYTFWATESLLGFWDGYAGNCNNYFFYLNPRTDRIHFLPWGADSLFVEKGKFDYSPNTPLSVKTIGMIAHRLYQREEYRERYGNELRRILAETWDGEALIAEIDRVSDLISPHVHSEQTRFAKAGEKIRSFIETRRERLLNEIADGMPEWHQPAREPIIVQKQDFGGGKGLSAGGKAILKAARDGRVDTVEKLVAKGVSVNVKDKMGSTPLGVAVLFEHPEVIKKLVELGADPNLRGPDGSVAVHGATFFGRESSLRALVESGADVNLKNAQGQTPLDIATVPWDEDMEDILRFIGSMLKVDLEIESIRKGRPQLAAYLKASGAKLAGELSKDGALNLWQAAKEGNMDVMAQHVKDGVDLNLLDEKGITPLAWAALTGNEKTVTWLVSKGADVNSKNRDGGTPLHAAAFLGHSEVAKTLLEKGADLEIKNLRGQTPLASAVDPWSAELEGIAGFIGGALEIDIDIDKMKTGRPEVVKLLRDRLEQ